MKVTKNSTIFKGGGNIVEKYCRLWGDIFFILLSKNTVEIYCRNLLSKNTVEK